jgi:hypothetical protein
VFALDINEEEKGNWTGSFRLVNGSMVEHTPQYTKMGFMQAGLGINLNSKSYNGCAMLQPLNLKTNSTRAEFIDSLKRSRLYKE